MKVVLYSLVFFCAFIFVTSEIPALTPTQATAFYNCSDKSSVDNSVDQKVSEIVDCYRNKIHISDDGTPKPLYYIRIFLAYSKTMSKLYSATGADLSYAEKKKVFDECVKIVRFKNMDDPMEDPNIGRQSVCFLQKLYIPKDEYGLNFMELMLLEILLERGASFKTLSKLIPN